MSSNFSKLQIWQAGWPLEHAWVRSQGQAAPPCPAPSVPLCSEEKEVGSSSEARALGEGPQGEPRTRQCLANNLPFVSDLATPSSERWSLLCRPLTWPDIGNRMQWK